MSLILGNAATVATHAASNAAITAANSPHHTSGHANPFIFVGIIVLVVIGGLALHFSDPLR